MLSELMYKEWVCEVKCLKQDFGQSKICVRERTFNVGCAQETESSLSLLLIELNIGYSRHSLVNGYHWESCDTL